MQGIEHCASSMQTTHSTFELHPRPAMIRLVPIPFRARHNWYTVYLHGILGKIVGTNSTLTSETLAVCKLLWEYVQSESRTDSPCSTTRCVPTARKMIQTSNLYWMTFSRTNVDQVAHWSTKKHAFTFKEEHLTHSLWIYLWRAVEG